MKATIVLVYLAIFLAAFTGWIMNIVAFVHSLHEPVSAMFFARLAGIPIGILGAVLGYV